MLDYVMYWPSNTPIAEKALLSPLAKLPIPAVAAKATNARINKYSTRPCPDSSLCRRMSEFRINVIMVLPLVDVGLCNVLAEQHADRRESTIESTGQTAHSGSGSEGNQRKDQQVLHQTLA